MAELDPVYLIVGGDRPKVDTALARLRARVGRDAVEEYTAAETRGADAVAACNALGLFATEARVVLVEGVDAWKAEDVKAVTAYLADPAPGTVLVLVGDAVKEDSALAKACRKAGSVLVYGFDKKRLPQWVAQQFAAAGVEADPEACAALVQLAVADGHDPDRRDLDQLASEVAKLVTWSGGEPVTLRAVEALGVPVAELPAFSLTDAWARRDTAEALRALETLFDRDEKPRRDVAPRLLGSLLAHVDRVRACQWLAAEGVRPKDAASRLKRHPFYVQKLYGQAENFSVEELRDVVVALAEADHALKGGARLAPDLVLERAVIAATQPRGRARVPA